MGTRNLICVVKNEQYKIAQYCQWDGYPKGQGKTVFNFVTEEMDEALLSKQLDKVKVLSEEEVKARWESVGARGSLVSLSISNRFEEAFPQLERGFGAKILSYVQTAESPELFLEVGFAADSLFCEWAYVVDLDRRTLEVYRGFNEKPLPPTARFKFLEKDPSETGPLGRSDKYFPIFMISSHSFEECSEMGLEAWTQEQEDIQDRLYKEEREASK